MSDLESVIRYSELLSLYQNLLSEAQKAILEDYFFYNLSLAEIAENRKTSRSAVEDAIKKGKKKLDEYEEKLCSLKVIDKLHTIKNENKDEKITSEIDEVERIMKHGIWIIKW